MKEPPDFLIWNDD